MFTALWEFRIIFIIIIIDLLSRNYFYIDKFNTVKNIFILANNSLFI